MSKPLQIFCKILFVFFLINPLKITAQSSGFAYIANSGSNNVTVINTATNTVVGSPIAVGSSPSCITVNPNSSKVYVSNLSGNTVSVINTATNTVVATISGFNGPVVLSCLPDGSRIYVANQSGNSVSVIDAATNTIIGSPIAVGNLPFGVSVTPDGSKVYVANTSSNTVSVISTATNTVIGNPIAVGASPVCVSVSPDGSKVYVSNYSSNNISVISTSTNTVIATIQLTGNSAGIQGNLSISADGSRAYQANQALGNVYVINAVTNTQVTTISVGAGPNGTSLTPDGSKLYVSNRNSNTVSVINTATNLVTATIGVGTSPFSIGNFITGSPGASLNFDGVDDKVVVTNSNVNLANISFSVEMWLKRGSEGTDDFVFSQGSTTGNNQSLHIGFRDNNNFTFAFYGNDLNVPGLSDLLWHHWACTFDDVTKIQKIYRDGVLVGQRTATSSFIGSGNTNLVIGVAAYGSAVPNFYNGNVDELRVWNTVRCNDQVSQLRNCELSGSESGLLAYYKFNQGTAGGDNASITTLIDATANGNNGTLNNFALTGATSNWVAPGGVTTGVSCGAVTAPEINVTGNGVTIIDGDVTPSFTDHTDFGSINTGASVIRTYTIQNTGTSNLTISGITITGTNASLFTPGGITLPATIAANGSTTFTVTFTPASAGLKTATINISNNDCDEANYDYSVQGTGVAAGTSSSATDYFRSITSGNWNSPATWESATDAGFTTGLVSPATLSPDYNSSGITIQSPHTITVTANVTIDQATVNNGGTVTINSGDTLFINDGTGYDITVNGAVSVQSGGNMYIRSTSTGTASVGTSSGTITGNVTVERYIPDDGHRAWRLLSVPTTGQTIRQAWQENGAAVNNLGVLITSHDYTDGFDAPPSNSASILMHDQGGGAGPSWLTRPVTSTNVPIANEQGYMLFVRGDRNATAANTLHDYTVLRTTGTVKQNTQPAVSVSSTGTGYTLVGNPYPSAIDFEAIHTTTNLDQQFYIWDANLSGLYGVGGFRLVERNGGAYRQTPQGGSVSADANSRYIHSGQAFFLKATGGNASVVFTEAAKTDQLPSINPFTPASAQQQITANLYAMNAGNILSLADGMRVVFDNSYSAGTTDDIDKITNFSENLAVIRNGKTLIVEKRPMISVSDTIFLRIGNIGLKNYQLQVNALDFVQTNMAGYLKDNYLNTTTQLNLSGTTIINFAVTADANSSAPDRFTIVFKPVSVLPVTLTSVKAYQQNSNISVEWKVENETGILKYEVEKSVDGTTFTNAATKNAAGNNQSAVSYNWLDVNAVPGNNYYRIKATSQSGRTEYSTIVKVYIGKGKPAILVYPNPVSDGIIHLQLINMPKGTYTLKLVNNLGQVMVTKVIEHAEGSSSETIYPGKNIAKGSYQLEVIHPDNSKTSNIIIY